MFINYGIHFFKTRVRPSIYFHGELSMIYLAGKGSFRIMQNMILLKKEKIHRPDVVKSTFMNIEKCVEEFISGCESGWRILFLFIHAYVHFLKVNIALTK